MQEHHYSLSLSQVAAPAFLLDVHLHKNENFLPSPGINMQLV
jgi:hypothetical protein